MIVYFNNLQLPAMYNVIHISTKGFKGIKDLLISNRGPMTGYPDGSVLPAVT